MTTNTQISDQMMKDFLKSEGIPQGLPEVENMIRASWKFLSTHSTVTEERREGWEVLEYIHPHSGTIVSGTYFSGNTIDEDIRKRYLIRSVKRLVDNSILTLGNDTPNGRISKFEYAHPDGKMYIHYDLGGWDYLSQVEKAPIPEEPKPVVKPPLGLVPEWMRKEERLEEVRAAVKRYIDANEPVPVNWIAEEYCLREWVENRKNQDKQPGDEA